VDTRDNIIFAGCSFTWGQGLYYCNKSFTDLKLPPQGIYDHSDKEFPNEKHIEFKNKNRFATLIANHFNCEPLVKEKNGGCNTSIHRFVLNKINSKTKYVVIQTTSFGRSESEPDGGGENITKQIEGFKKCVSLCKEKNIPIVFIHFDWDSSMIDEPPTDILEKTIKIENKLSFYDLIVDANSDIIVGWDWKDEFPKSQLGIYYDGHFNLKGHKLVAEQIINYFKNGRT
jgi:hypothetical protein